MLTLDKIGFEFGGRWLYKNATLQVSRGDRIGLVGRNGTGKTTLLRLILGEYTPTEGRVSLEKNCRIGFLNQELETFTTDRPVYEVAEEAFAPLLREREAIEKILTELERTGDPNLAAQLHERQAHFEHAGGYTMEARIREVLDGLGFDQASQSQPFNTFSGGWRMRVMLAQILLQQPDLLLLDEPTNHLDLPTIEWLESFLSGFPGALIVVSHDRYFLDRLINSTAEISNQKFNIYKGNYSFYLKERVMRREQQQRDFDNQQKVISEAERFIDRFRAKATKAAQAQSRVKMLEKLERIEAPEPDEAEANFTFRPSVQPGRTILALDVQRKAYGEKLILQNSHAEILRGDKIALIGANGLGKSTLLRILAGTEQFEGESKLGHNVQPAHFAQHQLETLNPALDILEQLDEFVKKLTETFVRSVLGGFLFTGDDVYKKISVLSGGEKSRVALARTLLSDANFLLLDEPTNHLDMSSIGVLVKALQNYEGTFVVISHDRWFLSQIANKIWYIENRELKVYPGKYEEYTYHLKLKNQPPPKAQPVKVAAAPVKESQPAEKKEAPRPDYFQDKERKKMQRRLEDKVKQAEEKVASLETKRAQILEQMGQPEIATDHVKIAELQSQLKRTETDIALATMEWEQAFEQLEQNGN